jgi:hypothetical protein
MEPLLGPGFVTAQQVDQARTAQRTTQIALQQARLQADEARQAITNTKPTEAELEGARATLALAERDLNKTVVRAPCDGRITALDIAAGEFVATGHPLFTIIDTEQWYAIGNFRETDLAGIEPGQRATVYVMAQPHRPVSGKVDSLGWGVASDVSATFGGADACRHRELKTCLCRCLFWEAASMPYCITFRAKSDAYPTGWYTGDNCRWSTDDKRKKLFARREDAEPVLVRLRELCPSNAESINLETPRTDEPES